jgi:hypothetical protein
MLVDKIDYGKDFTLTHEHLKLLKHVIINWDSTEFGAPCIDPKRPYGNSDVPEDIAEILGEELFEDRYGEYHLSKKQGDRLEQLHRDLETVLAIVLGTQSFVPGEYHTTDYYDPTKWKLVKAGPAK